MADVAAYRLWIVRLSYQLTVLGARHLGFGVLDPLFRLR